MEISESSKLYLENYYVLEQARTDAHKYLERIIINVANEVEEWLNDENDRLIPLRVWVQKGGGHACFIFDKKEPLHSLESIDQWKFSINYRDAMRSEYISSPTKCTVYCYAPQNVGKQNYELKRMTNKLGYPDLFRKVEIDLLGAPAEEIVLKIKLQIIELYEQFVRTVEALIR